MLIDGDQARVTCVCVVNGTPAGFQIDCGSTFSHICPELAPERVPRHGLGSAACLGRRLWFPTCKVQLAPVDEDGYAVHPDGADEPLTTRVQVGSSNLLGLHELRRWRVELSFTPEVHHCSVRPPSKEHAHDRSGSPPLGTEDTLPLADALRAASALNKGTVTLEEACCSERPWLVDASKVVAVLRSREQISLPSWWSGFDLPVHGDALIAACPPASAAKASPLGLSPSLPVTADVLFGTADALLSESQIPPLLPPPFMS